MATDPLQSAIAKWNSRFKTGGAMGLSTAALQAVSHADLQKVGLGGTAMSNQEALAAVQSASQGQLVNPPKHPSTSLFNLVGNAGKDLGNILQGMAIGATHVVEHPARDITGVGRGVGETVHEIFGNPSAAWDAAHGYERADPGGNALSNLGSALRNTAHTPVGKLIPGMTTTANLASGKQGVKAIEEHPLLTAVDIAAIPGVRGLVEELGKLSPLSSVAGTPAEAAAKGQITRTAFRAAQDGVQRLLGPKVRVGGTVQELLSQYQLTQDASKYFSQLSAHARGVFATPEDHAVMWESYLKEHETVIAIPGGEITYGQGFGPSDPYFGATPPQTWHEVSAVIKTGQFELSRTTDEGWYVRHPGETQEVLIPRKGVSIPSVSTEPLGYDLALKDWPVAVKDAHDPNSNMSDAQRSFVKTFENPTPDQLRLLPQDQQGVIRVALRSQGLVGWLGYLSQSGTLRTTADIEAIAKSLPANLRDNLYGGAHSNYVLIDSNDIKSAMPKALRDGLNAEHSGGWVPRDVYNVAFGPNGMFRETKDYPALKLTAPLTRIFKASVFLRPQMIIHIALANMIQMTGEGVKVWSPELISRAYDMAQHGDLAIASPSYTRMSADQLWHRVVGEKLGKLIDQIPNGMRRIIDHITSVQRAMTYITGHDKGIEAGLDESAARMAGIDAVNRVMMTMDQMTPFERTVVKQIFPFYSFQKHLFIYLSKFPINHPFITNVISKIGEQESLDAQSGLPSMFQQMFFLGQPDTNGNVHAIDTRSFNPFRNFANDFSLTGLASSVNPVLGVALRHFGVNTQGAPELYPTLTVDPQTGTLTTVRPNAGGLAGLAEAIVPELRTVDAMLGFNSRLKSLKIQDPSAYKAYLWQSLGVPFPQTVNVPQEVARNEEAVFKVAQQDVSSFMKTGDFSYINGYLQVPFAGKMWQPSQLQSWYELQKQHVAQALAANPNVNLRALLPTKKPAAPPGATVTEAAGL